MNRTATTTRKIPLVLLPALLFLWAACLAPAAHAARPKAGDILPDAQVKAVPKAEEARYLGLDPARSGWRLSEIKAEALLVVVYSMYCPRCQAEAPAINRLFERLAASPEGARLKMLGVAAGNSPFEVEFYRKKYQARMPLAPDADYALHKHFGEVGTPSFFVLRRAPGGFAVHFYQEGPFENEAAFLEQVLRAAGGGAKGKDRP